MFKSIFYYGRYILEGQTTADGNTYDSYILEGPNRADRNTITHTYLTMTVIYWKAKLGPTTIQLLMHISYDIHISEGHQAKRSPINTLMVHPLNTQQSGSLLIKIIEYVQKHMLLRQIYIRRPN